MENVRIGLIGCSGLGKSAVAKEISVKLEIPYLDSKSVTRPILKEYGYSQGEKVERFLSHSNIEFELVERKLKMEGRNESFVTDRTTLECFAYAFQNLETYHDDDLQLLETLCKSNMANYTHLFKFPYEGGWWEDNGIRTLDRNFQRWVDLTIQGIMRNWGISVIDVPNVDEKAQWILDRISFE